MTETTRPRLADGRGGAILHRLAATFIALGLAVAEGWLRMRTRLRNGTCRVRDDDPITFALARFGCRAADAYSDGIARDIDVRDDSAPTTVPSPTLTSSATTTARRSAVGRF